MKNSNKIVTVIMGQNCEKFIGMCLDSVKDSDAIVYCDGGSTDGTQYNLLEKGYQVDEKYAEGYHNSGEIHWEDRIVIVNNYDQEDKGMNGKQRNFYLDYVKKHFPDYWCLCLDADEIVEDFNKIKKFINKTPEGVYSVKMRHLIGDLGHEDSTVAEHFVLNRLFKVSCADKYQEVEHPVLQPVPTSQQAFTSCTTIWHLAYIPNMWDIKKRYDNHSEKSNIHTPEYLKNWYMSHLFGMYPKKQFNPVELPQQLLDEFNVDRDELYFANGGLEHKHWIDSMHWKDHFKCKSVIEFGCGRGPRIFALDQMGIKVKGVEISQFAILNKVGIGLDIIEGDITVEDLGLGSYDLVVAYDVLEHLDYGEDLFKAIDNLINHSNKYILVSVPVIGDPNLENDSTHKIRETKEWWIEQFTNKQCIYLNTPDHFMFKEQIYIFEVKK